MRPQHWLQERDVRGTGAPAQAPQLPGMERDTGASSWGSESLTRPQLASVWPAGGKSSDSTGRDSQGGLPGEGLNTKAHRRECGKVRTLERWSQLRGQQGEGTGKRQHQGRGPRGRWAVRLEKTRLRNLGLCPQGRGQPCSKESARHLSLMGDMENEALQGLGKKRAGVQERSGSRFRRCFREGGTKLWCLLEAGGRAGPLTPSL